MEVLSKPVRMNQDMVRLLDLMRSSKEPYPIYQQPAAEADEKVCDIGQSLVTDANLQFAVRNQYMWYVRELARLFRTRFGRDLAFHLELVMRKWQSLGLSPNVMQVIACEVHNALKPAEPVLPSFGNAGQRTEADSPQSHEDTGEKPEARNPNDESNPKSDCRTGSAVSCKLSAVSGWSTAKAAKTAKHENDEARNPNDESSPKSEWPKAVSGERSAVGPSSVPDPRPQTPEPTPQEQP